MTGSKIQTAIQDKNDMNRPVSFLFLSILFKYKNDPTELIITDKTSHNKRYNIIRPIDRDLQ